MKSGEAALFWFTAVQIEVQTTLAVWPRTSRLCGGSGMANRAGGWYFLSMPAPHPQVELPVPAPSVLERRRAALEEAKRRPLPSPEEHARLMALVAETGKGTMTAEDFRAKLAARRPAAAE